MEMVEKEGLWKGCVYGFVDIFSFQVFFFYEK